MTRNQYVIMATGLVAAIVGVALFPTTMALSFAVGFLAGLIGWVGKQNKWESVNLNIPSDQRPKKTILDRLNTYAPLVLIVIIIIVAARIWYLNQH